MTSVKVKFRPSTVTGKMGSIYYQVIHGRMVRQISTNYKILSSEWNQQMGHIVNPHSSQDRFSILQDTREKIKWDQKRLIKIITSLDKRPSGYTADEIVFQFHQNTKEQSLFTFMQYIIKQLKSLYRIRTAETYQTTLNSFMTFREGHDILFDDITSDLIQSYQAHLQQKGISMNTISFYMRILRATYNRAVDKELTTQHYPFRHVYTGIGKTVKRAVPFKTIKQLKLQDLSYDTSLDFARDMFLFSFYTRGMSFIDMAYLKKKDLHNEVLIYRRRKTGQQLFIRWEKCMQDIVDKYGPTPTEYLLPIIQHQKEELKQYRNALHLINHKLRKISKILELPSHITMYVARHSWASIAKSQNIPIGVISEGMGHDSESTTRIYLASLDSSIIDKANRMIINKI